MNRRQKIIMSVTGIFLVLLILVGLTYAYFLTQIQGNEKEKSITVTTANLILEYGDGNGILETDKLEPSNDFISFKDSEGNSVPSKIFTVTNKGNATVEGYKVYLENVQNQLERKDDLVYTLSCKSYINYGETNQAESGTCTGVSTETTFPSVITSIVSNDINVGVTHVYELKAKYKEMNVDQSIDMNKTITAKINIYDGSTKFLAREIIDNANAADSITPFVEYSQLGTYENTTIPLQAASLENEHILSSTLDYYGTSYFYRGSVQNNYVLFNNLCWRIVRIEGDGSIKLTLAGTPTNNTCENLSTTGGLVNNYYSYVFDPETYHDDELGEIPTELNVYSRTTINNWYNMNFDIPEKLYIKPNTLWCKGFNDYIMYDLNGEEIDSWSGDYSDPGIDLAVYRLFYEKRLSLMCNEDNELDLNNAGALTADEVILAGASINGNDKNKSFYLYEQGQNNYWTNYRNGYMNGLTLFVTEEGALDSASPLEEFSGRPTISLITSVKIVKGNGTNKTPYIIDIS